MKFFRNKWSLTPLALFFRSGLTMNRLALRCFAVTGTMIAVLSHTVAGESPRIEREADKLKIVREVLQQQKFTPVFTPEPKLCTRFMQDLAAGRDVEAVEPDVRTDSKDDPRLEKWKRCDGVARTGAKDPRQEYLGMYMLGDPPYRYYRIDLDGNPKNGQEDLLYHELSKKPHATGRTGYSWVDINQCAFKGGVSLSSMTLFPDPPPGYYKLNLLSRYRTEVVALELVPVKDDVGVVKYHLTMQRISKRQPRVCTWR